MKHPNFGDVCHQVAGRFIGRRGKCIGKGTWRVTLAPLPGTCPCPLKQRTTSIKWTTFEREWEVEEKKP